jgi:CHAD domain-containing protein
MLLTPEQRIKLQEVVEQSNNAPYDRYARILLLYDEGKQTYQVAAEIGLSRSRTRYIKQLFLERGIDLFDSEVSRQKSPSASTEGQSTSNSVPDLKPELQSPGVETNAGENFVDTISVKQLIDENKNDASRHVSRLARELFRSTRQIHQMGEREEQILIAASRLHSIKTKGKARQNLILQQPLEGFSTFEQEQIALLVRHQQFDKTTTTTSERTLKTKGAKNTLQLLSLLRIAVALDNSNSHSTEIDSIKVTNESLNINITGSHALTDATAAQSAAVLFAHIFNMPVHVNTNSLVDMDQIRQAAAIGGPGLHPDDTMPEAGRKVIRFHFLQMLMNEAGTRLGEDIEALHDMRVATRRMRAAFDVYGEYFQAKKTKNLRNGLRATGRALGAVRDLDVFMHKAEIYLEGLPESSRAGLDPLLHLWHASREESRGSMVAHLDSVDYQNFVKTMNEFTNSPGEAAREFNPSDPQPYRVREVAPMLIYNRLAAVRAYDQIVHSASYQELHALRINFKYLRYTLEFFREVLGDEAKEVIEKIKSVQDHLGDLNDADVACGILQEFLVDWESRQLERTLDDRQNPEPVYQYLAFQAAERHRLLTTFSEVWSNFNQPIFLKNVALAVSVL